MRKLATAAAAAVCTLASFAQQPLQCPHPDILNGLVLLGRSDIKMTVTRGSTGFLGNFRAPAGFMLIGTGVRDSSTTVAYKTSQSSDKAFAALVAALGAEGWAAEAQPGTGATFNVAGAPKEGILCLNGERRAILATEVEGISYVTVNSYPSRGARECNTPDPAMNLSFGMGAPRFQFPAGTSLAQGFGGGGGSNQSYSTSSRIISPETPARLVEHLASQIEAQGWQPDSGWSGAGSAGSTWSKTVNGQSTSGLLDIVRVSADTHDVSFTLTSAP